MKKILILLLLVGMISCSKRTCPTTDKRFFTKGTPKSKMLYTKSYKRKTEPKYIVPKKYRRGISNYGQLK